MENNNLDGKEARQKMKDLVEDVKIAMMCTRTKDDSIHSRPMATAGVDDDGTLWFFTNEDSEKIEEIQDKRGLCLCYSKPSDNTYACIMGLAFQTDDQAKKEELWNPMLKAWFPEGKDDPNMTLIKVNPHHGEYWDSNDSRMIEFFKIAKAAVTGGTYDGSDSHGEMRL